MIQPSSFEQYMLELINRARKNPFEEAELFEIDLNEGLDPGEISGAAKAPVFMNMDLLAASRYHSDWMLGTNTFSHTGANGSSPGDRMEQFGYEFISPWSWAENVAWRGTSGDLPEDLTEYIDVHHEGLFLSPGHRVNILGEDFKEVGVGQELGVFTQDGTDYNASMVTQKYANSGEDVYLGGVIYKDLDGNDFYTPGEGLGDVMISIPELDLYAQSATSGGYQMVVPPGTYDVVFSGGFLSAAFTQTVSLSDTNKKLDLVLDEDGWSDWPIYDDGDWDDDWDDDDWDDHWQDSPSSNEVFTLYDSSKQTPMDLVNAMVGNISGISIIDDSVNYIGADSATSTFESFDFGGSVRMNNSGILLTSGDGAP
ncbi:CAP domain-containing protein, partial [Ectothiorhodospira haloalkaliphila]|uniref:CAP domain-containing protein n=1 Tax=Ectothiorhodospira haloalkaliphila TaxID=421628 RepID=UPI001EE78A7C